MDRTILTEHIVRTAFKNSMSWEPPKLVPYVGPSMPEFFDEFLVRRDQKIAHARRSLGLLPDAHLQAEFHRSNGHRTRDMVSQSPAISDALSAGYFLRIPPWYAGGFGVEGKEADFDYWAKMNSWSWAETTALAIGFEPMEHVPSIKDDPPIAFVVLQFYERYRKLIANNFFPFGEGTLINPSPLAFVAGP